MSEFPSEYGIPETQSPSKHMSNILDLNHSMQISLIREWEVEAYVYLLQVS